MKLYIQLNLLGLIAFTHFRRQYDQDLIVRYKNIQMAYKINSCIGSQKQCLPVLVYVKLLNEIHLKIVVTQYPTR
jgi:hypothetical protein